MNTATSTILQTIFDNPNIIPALISGIVAAIVALLGQYYFFRKNRDEEKYQKLYGPLIYHLLHMKLLTESREQLTEEIGTIFNDPNYRRTEMQTHGRRLVVQWIQHKESIERLLRECPGYIRKEHLSLISNFLDGCIKREITEHGKNEYATPERTQKLLDAIKTMQEKLIS